MCLPNFMSTAWKMRKKFDLPDYLYSSNFINWPLRSSALTFMHIPHNTIKTAVLWWFLQKQGLKFICIPGTQQTPSMYTCIISLIKAGWPLLTCTWNLSFATGSLSLFCFMKNESSLWIPTWTVLISFLLLLRLQTQVCPHSFILFLKQSVPFSYRRRLASDFEYRKKKYIKEQP